MSEPIELYRGMMLNNAIGYIAEGAYAGWICAKHPDGQWVTICKLPVADLERKLIAARAALVALRNRMNAMIPRNTDLIAIADLGIKESE
jgi:hypothetical protein